MHEVDEDYSAKASTAFYNLIINNEPICSDSFLEDYCRMCVVREFNQGAPDISKLLLERNQFRYLSALLMAISDGDMAELYAKKVIPQLKDKVIEFKNNPESVSYDAIDEMLLLIATTKLCLGLNNVSIENNADFKNECKDICEKYANKGLTQEQIETLVKCEYNLEQMGLDKVIQMSGGKVPVANGYRFGHPQDRERYLSRGALREDYVRRIYGDIEFEKQKYYFDTRDFIARGLDPITSLIDGRNPTGKLPDRIY